MKREIYTDGGCCPATTVGAWAVVVMKDGNLARELSGAERSTTNNRMEMKAIIEALKLAEPGDVIHSDSELCLMTLNRWAAGWERRGWKRKGGPVKNLDLVQTAWALKQAKPGVELKWVKAHCGIVGNEIADGICEGLINEVRGFSVSRSEMIQIAKGKEA